MTTQIETTMPTTEDIALALAELTGRIQYILSDSQIVTMEEVSRWGLVTAYTYQDDEGEWNIRYIIKKGAA